MSIFKTTLFSSLILATFIFAQTQHTTVTKKASNNPSIGIVNFSGDAAARAQLENLLDRCGWFSLQHGAAANTADIKLNVIAPSKTQVAAAVTAQGNAFKLNQTGNEALYAAVDDILRNLYKLPAYCTRKIYFVQPGNDNRKELFACYLDGTGMERVTNNNAISTEPRWGHANALVYTLIQGNSLKIVLSDMANNRQRVVSNSPGLNSSAALSRDGKTIALPLSLDNQIDLYLIQLDNNLRKVRLTKDKNVESSPSWSPDGKQLCYVSDKLGVPQLYVRTLGPAPSERRISIGGNECVSPSWSQHSNKICFSFKSNTGQRVIAMLDLNDPNGTPKILTHAAGDWEAPCWSPDDRHIVCTRAVNAKTRDLYIVDSWTSTFQAITRGAQLSLPAWRPF